MKVRNRTQNEFSRTNRNRWTPESKNWKIPPRQTAVYTVSAVWSSPDFLPTSKKLIRFFSWHNFPTNFLINHSLKIGGFRSGRAMGREFLSRFRSYIKQPYRDSPVIYKKDKLKNLGLSSCLNPEFQFYFLKTILNLLQKCGRFL